MQLLLGICLISLFSCQKEFLDKKSNKSLLIPETLADFQSMLDNMLMNRSPNFQHIAADDCFVDDGAFNTLDVLDQNSYIWASDPFQKMTFINDWNVPYQQIFYCNIILEGLDKIKPAISEVNEFNQIRASALFFRAFAFYKLLQVFALPYGNGNENSALGIPIRLSSDVNEVIPRATLQESYAQVIKDLEISINLFNSNVYLKTRPSKTAAYAGLARIYLSMSKYDLAKKYATLTLASNDKLLDYNTLDSTLARPLPNVLLTGVNDEVIFYANLNEHGFNSLGIVNIDSVLSSSYKDGDLRKPMFFRKNGRYFVMKGNYTGARPYFYGFATDEILLILSECLAREGAVEESLVYLNKLLIKRWKKNQFTPIVAIDQKDALQKILDERRKELVCRGLRWSDLRRLNLTDDRKIVLKRIVLKEEYILLPNDKRYVFPLPDEAIILGGLIQNER